MPLIQYIERNFNASSTLVIDQANVIIDEYETQGYSLTLRQLYYQFVARDLLGNTQQNYKRLGSIVNDGRLAGLIDWNSIEDRTRNLKGLAHWEDPSAILQEDAEAFRFDKWAEQENRVEVWIEKEALAGVFERICNELDVNYFSCRGYVSQSELWRAAMRLRRYMKAGQFCTVLHFGDHDPSGIDMTRDITDRLTLFGAPANVNRLALNMDQVREYNPPPNPAKLSDSRAADYVANYGDESWELDALEPSVLSDLVRDAVLELRDEDNWDSMVEQEQHERESLQQVADNWGDVREFVGDL